MIQTKTCKICFDSINDISLNNIVDNYLNLCPKCYTKLEPKFFYFKEGKVQCISIYEYDENIKSLIYQFKGCFDYELKDIFIERFKRELSIKYHDYILMPVPSSKEDDERRGFNHVDEIFKTLGLKMDYRIQKKIKTKQSDKTAKEREKIKDFLFLNNASTLKGKKILLVDDIYTTGSTVRACIELIQTLNPRRIEVLVICKTKLKPI